MYSQIRATGIGRWAVATTALSLCLTGCGRGPVEPAFPAANATITIQLFVQGQITPSQGDYIIAINANTANGNVNSGNNEQPGEPTSIEAYGSNPAPFTHWDQAFVYGNNPHGLPSCPLAPPPPNGYSYCYKALRTIGGQISVSFVPIFLAPNDIKLIPNGNGGGGTGNALSLTLPISCLSLRPSSTTQSCDTVTADVNQIYVNFVTLDNTGVPQDQLACLAAQTFFIDLTLAGTTPLVKSSSCSSPSNTNLVITGGQVTITNPTQ
jgi:hypothetical protein